MNASNNSFFRPNRIIGIFGFFLFIRLSSYSQPNTIPNLALWLSADSVVLNGSNVQQWTDRSGNANHAIQNNAAQQPTRVNNITSLNNYPVVNFNGTDDFLEIADTPSIDFTDKMTIFIVTKQSVLMTDKAILCKWDYATQGSWGFQTNFSDNKEMVMFIANALNDGGGNYMSTLNANNTDSVFYIMTLVYNGNESVNVNRIKFYKNGDSLSTSPVGAISSSLQNSSATLKIGMFGGSLLRYYNGDIAEIIIYDTTLTTTQRQQVEKYLSDKYAPPVNLGADITVNYGFCPVKINAHKDWFISYLWNTGATTDSISVTNSGTYSVTVTNIFGYTSSDTISVTFPGNLSPFPDTTICYGNTLVWNTQLDTLGYDFLWQDSSTDSVLLITQAGQYSVTVTDSFGCIWNSNTINISIDSFPITASLGSDKAICSGENIFLASGASQATSYTWSTGATTSSIIVAPTAAGTYTFSVLVTNSNGCSAEDTISVTVKGFIPVVNFSAPDVCFPDSIQFNDLSTATPPDTITAGAWLWNFGDASPNSTQQNPAHSYTTSGTYTVTLTVTTDSNCAAAMQQTVAVNAKPNANFSLFSPQACTDTSTFFSDQSVITSGSLVGWHWDFGDLSAIDDTSNIQNPAYTYTAAGTYTVQLIVTSDSGCKDTIANTVTVFPTPVASFTATAVCQGNITTFNSPAGMSNWGWNFGDAFTSTLQNPTHQYTVAGTYGVTLTVTANGCTSQPVVDTVQVYYLPVPVFFGDSVCVNSPLQLMDSSSVIGSTINAWNWNFINGIPSSSTLQNPTVTYTATGNYYISLTVTSAQGCSSFTITQPVSVQPLPTADFSFSPTYGSPPLSVNFNGSLSSGATGYQWYFGDGGQSASQNPNYIYQNTGTFPILLISQSLFGCVDSMRDTILVDYPLLDIAVLSVSAAKSSNTIQVSALLKNTGTLDVTTIELSAYFDNGTPVHEFRTGLAEPNKPPFFYPFNSSLELVNDRHSIVCVEVKKVNGKDDDVIPNNKKCIAITDEFTLLDPFPNPTIDEIYFLFVLPDASHVKAQIWDVRGRLVEKLFDGDAVKGFNQITYNTFKLDNGIYVLKLSYKNKNITKIFMKE